MGRPFKCRMKAVQGPRWKGGGGRDKAAEGRWGGRQSAGRRENRLRLRESSSPAKRWEGPRDSAAKVDERTNARRGCQLLQGEGARRKACSSSRQWENAARWGVGLRKGVGGRIPGL